MSTNRRIFQLPNDSQEAIPTHQSKPKIVQPKRVLSPVARNRLQIQAARNGEPSEAAVQEDTARVRRQLEQEDEQWNQEMAKWRNKAKEQHEKNSPIGAPAPEYTRHLRRLRGEILSERGSADNARYLLKEVLEDHEKAVGERKRTERETK